MNPFYITTLKVIQGDEWGAVCIRSEEKVTSKSEYKFCFIVSREMYEIFYHLTNPSDMQNLIKRVVHKGCRIATDIPNNPFLGFIAFKGTTLYVTDEGISKITNFSIPSYRRVEGMDSFKIGPSVVNRNY
jgi:hypothetical protein